MTPHPAQQNTGHGATVRQAALADLAQIQPGEHS